MAEPPVSKFHIDSNLYKKKKNLNFQSMSQCFLMFVKVQASSSFISVYLLVMKESRFIGILMEACFESRKHV